MATSTVVAEESLVNDGGNAYHAVFMSLWFTVFPSQSRPRARLLCFAHAGGSAAVFRPWAALVPGDVELVAVELPARRARLAEPAVTSIAAIVSALTNEVGPLLDRPFALFGHSMGAIVAFEFARALRELGRPLPAQLFVSGARAPQLARVPDLHTLPREAFIAGVVALGGLPVELTAEPDLMDLVLPALRADFTAIETWRYAPAPPFTFPITAFGGTEDPRVAERQLALWAEHTTGPFGVRVFPGGHFYLDKHRAALLELLQF
jgi:surfactin synthase thioesterase subunit